MEVERKKKYRVASDLCYTYGFSLLFFDDQSFTHESKYGLFINSRRCKSLIGAQICKSKLSLVGSSDIDLDILDSMNESDGVKELDSIIMSFENYLTQRRQWMDSRR